VGNGLNHAAAKQQLQKEARRDPTPKRSTAIHVVVQRSPKKRKSHSVQHWKSASPEGLMPEAHGARERSAVAMEPRVQRVGGSSAVSLQQTGQNLTEHIATQSSKAGVGTKQLPESTPAVVEHHPLTIEESKVESMVQRLVQSKVESGLQQLLESRRVQELLESTVQMLLDSSRVQELLDSRFGSSSFKPCMQSKPSDLEQMEQEFAGGILSRCRRQCFAECNCVLSVRAKQRCSVL
jgi:hypothetical protein